MFRPLLPNFRAFSWPWTATTPSVERPVYDENGNASPATDRRGVIWTRNIQDPGLFEAIPNLMDYPQQINTISSGGTLISADPAYLISVKSVAGDPATAFSANPIYLQFFNRIVVPNPGDVPFLSFPVPPPPDMLQVDFKIPNIVGDDFNVGIWYQYSTTFGTYTAGPTGALFVTYAARLA